MSDYEQGLNKGIEIAYEAILTNIKDGFTMEMQKAFCESGLERTKKTKKEHETNSN